MKGIWLISAVKIFIIGGLSFFILLGYWEIKGAYFRKELQISGEEVSGKIIFLPSCDGRGSNRQMQISINKKIIHHKIKAFTCKKFKEGTIIKLKYDKEKSIVVLNEENPLYGMPLNYLFLFLCIIGIVYILFKKPG